MASGGTKPSGPREGAPGALLRGPSTIRRLAPANDNPHPRRRIAARWFMARLVVIGIVGLLVVALVGAL